MEANNSNGEGPYDCVVVGAGIQGSCTALHLIRSGKRTLLVDQFQQGHDRGSSHGGSRVIRYAYKEPHFARLMPAAYKAWNAIEYATGKEIIVKTGRVAVSTRPPHKSLDSLIATMSSLSLPHDIVDGRALRERWPSLHYPNDTKAVVDPMAGMLKADVALQAVQDLFIQAGGEMKWGVTIERMVPGTPVILKTSSEDIVGSSVVLCVGPWAKTLLSSLALSLPLEPRRLGVLYWPEKTEGAYSAPGNPVLADMDTHEEEVFGLPSLEYPGMVKICYNGGIGQPDPEISTTDIDEDIQKMLSQYIQNHIPGIEGTPNMSKSSTCFYTMTPDRNFILDRHPHHKNIVIGAGFSGTGFKLGPIVGHILANFVLELDPPYDVSHFKIDRFSTI